MRIRTIKPEFWRSDDITALSREHRLLFIGLWSYVDDNGVGVDDFRQIAADLFALEEDQKEVRDFIREGLATLSRALLIDRYEVDDKRYLYIKTWKRHQRVDRPNKGRYPEPPPVSGPPTSGNDPPGDTLDTVSRESREAFATVSPSGTEEQRNRGTAAKAAAAPKRGDGDGGQIRVAQDITRAYTERVPLSKFPAVLGIVRRALRANHPADAVRAALLRLADEGRPVTVDVLRVELEGLPPPSRFVPPSRLTTDDKIRRLQSLKTGTDATAFAPPPSLPPPRGELR